MTTTIAKSIQDIAFILDLVGRTSEPIRVKSERSTILKAAKHDERFSVAEGGALFYGLHPLVLLGGAD